MRDAPVTLRLSGPVRVIGPGGVDLTPRQAKALGLLALLGVSPEHRRPRTWLQDKLWSDSAPERGAASLRQCLSDLRAALGPWREALSADWGWVGLDRDRVRVLLDPEPGDWSFSGEPPEFAAGLDIADPEFEDWLRDQRMAFEERLAPSPPPAPARAAPPVLGFAIRPGGDVALDALAAAIASEAAALAAALTGARAVEVGAGERPARIIEVSALDRGETALVQARWRDAADGAVRASALRAVRRRSGEPGGAEIERLVAETAFAGVLDLGVETHGPALSPAPAALRSLASFEPQRIDAADRLLARAPDAARSPAIAAWRAHLRVASLLERWDDGRGAAAEEAIAFARLALEGAPHCGFALAIASEVALNVERRTAKALALAEQAADRASANPLARRALAHALTAAGRRREAHRESARALQLAVGWPNVASWRMSCCLAAVRCGRYEEAERMALTAHELSPLFKAPLRFLAALRFHRGDAEGAAAALTALRALEPDFTLDLMAEESYPVATLRSTPLIAVTRSGLI